MKPQVLFRNYRRYGMGGVSIALCMAFVLRVLAQGTVALAITSPINGAVVTAGQALPVSVSIASGTYPNGLAVFGQAPLGVTPIQPVTGPTMSFTLTVPGNTPPGSYLITAAGPNAAGALVSSTSISVVVERADLPTKLSVHPAMVIFRYAGETLPFSVFATFADGSMADVTQSTHLSATTEDSAFATVKNGIISAVSSGQTNIDLQYGSITAKIPVSVPSTIRGDLNGDGIVDKADVALITDALNTPANGPSDARDLNHDGVINALDARIAVTLCTHPGCTSQ
jgi:Dockerin type I domain